MVMTLIRRRSAAVTEPTEATEATPAPAPDPPDMKEPRWMHFKNGNGGGVYARYDRDNPVDMLRARELFNEMGRQRVMLYMASDTDLARPSGTTRHELTRDFDPHAAEYVMQRPYAGG